jgi:hypothetical protein
MIVAAVILAVLVILAFLPVGVVAEYGEPGLTADAVVGPVRFKLISTAKNEKKKKKEKKKTAEGVTKAGRLVDLKEQLPAINKALDRLKRKLTIKELTVHYMAAGTDPASTALYFGAASIGFGLILPLLENNFNIKKRDLRTSVSFETTEPYVYVKARLSLLVWEVLYIASGALISIMKYKTKKTEDRKAVEQHGKTSDRRSDGNNNAEDQRDD